MAINVACRCGKQMRVGQDLAGLRARCPACGRRVRIPRITAGLEATEPASSFDDWPRPAGPNRLKIALLGSILLLIAAGTGFGLVYLNQDRPLIDAPAAPVASAPLSKVEIPPVSSSPQPSRTERLPAATPPQAAKAPPPADPKPEPSSTPLPSVDMESMEPAEPQAGKPLAIQLKGNREGLRFEFRTDAESEWQPAPEGRIALTAISPGPLSLEIRARDDRDRVSEVVNRVWLVKSDLRSTLVGIDGSTKADRPEKGRVQGDEPSKEPMKPLVQGAPVPKEPDRPGVQGGDPRRDPQLLLWKLKSGDKLFQEVQVAQKSAYRIQGLDVGTGIQYTVLSSLIVDKKNSDGSLQLTQKIEAARLVQADALTEGLLTGALQKMPGTAYKLTLNPQMEVTAFDGLQNPLRLIGGDPFGGGAFAMASLIDKDGWKEVDQVTFFQPGRSLRLNERWQKPQTHNWGALGSWSGQVTYGYKGKQGQFHRVAYAMNLAHAPAKPGLAGLPFQVSTANFKHQQAGGMIYFDAEKGRVIGAEERFHVQGVLGLSAGGQNAAIELDEEQAFRVIVYDRNPWQK